MPELPKAVKTDRQRVGLVGLGNMGRGVAENLLKHRFPLTVFSRSDRVEKWAEARQGVTVTVTRSLRELAENSDVVLLAVTDGPAVQKGTLTPFSQKVL